MLADLEYSQVYPSLGCREGERDKISFKTEALLYQIVGRAGKCGGGGRTLSDFMFSG